MFKPDTNHELSMHWPSSLLPPTQAQANILEMFIKSNNSHIHEHEKNILIMYI